MDLIHETTDLLFYRVTKINQPVEKADIYVVYEKQNIAAALLKLTKVKNDWFIETQRDTKISLVEDSINLAQEISRVGKGNREQQ